MSVRVNIQEVIIVAIALLKLGCEFKWSRDIAKYIFMNI